MIFSTVYCFCSCSKVKHETPAHKPPQAAAEIKIPASVIQEIKSEEELRRIVENTGDRLAAFDLYADWCKPCKMLSPFLEQLAAQHSSVLSFYKINVDSLPAATPLFGVMGIPHVAFVKNKKVVATLVGVQPPTSYTDVISRFATSK